MLHPANAGFWNFRLVFHKADGEKRAIIRQLLIPVYNWRSLRLVEFSTKRFFFRNESFCFHKILVFEKKISIWRNRNFQNATIPKSPFLFSRPLLKYSDDKR